MKAVLRQFGSLLLLVSCGVAQGMPASLRGVKVMRNGNDIQVEVSLTDHVQPSVLSTEGPARLVLDFPNTTANARQQRIVVNWNGVRAVRFGLHSAQPAIARVVVDLDSTHVYEWRRNGTTISLTVSQPAASRAVRRVPPAAASRGVLDIFGRRGPSPRVPDPDEGLRRPVPWSTPARGANGSSTASANSAPTAAHPNRGSLQEGTVVPGLGAPGTGNVPAVIGGAPRTVAPAATAAGTSAASSHDTPTPGMTVTAKASQDAPVAPSANTLAKEAVPSVPVKNDSLSSTKARSSTNQPASDASQAATVVTPGASNSSGLPSQLPGATSALPSPSQPVSALGSAASAPPVTAAVPAKSQPLVPVSPTPAERTATPGTAVASPGTARKEQTTEVAAAAPPNEVAIPPGATTNEPAAPTPEIADQSGFALFAIDPSLKTVFQVKYVAEGVVYLDGGRSSGLAEGMKLEIKDTDLPIKQGATADPNDPRVVAELEVTAVAETSAVTDVHTPKRPVKAGDVAYLSSGDTQSLIQQRTLSPTRQYPVVIAFTEGDPLDEEVRKEVPRPPQPSVNRVRGRIGFDYMGTISHGTPGSTNSDFGMVLRADVTRIYGTYWNLSGYWRGRLHSSSATNRATLQDLINRTYHLGMFYDNPGSRWVAGVGRMYLPWAPSLETIDGGYFGAKLGGGATAGIFAGSTPDPTSWSYNPDRRLAGAFINFQGGDYDAFRYTSTSGMGVSALKWQIDRPFVFFENSLSYKRYLSIYDSLQADSPRGNAAVPAPGPGLSRNFLTVRLQVHPRVELNFNHNYLRDVPTYDPSLVGTGLLDKYLFQGASVGARIEVVKQVFVYTNLGSSNRSGDAKRSLNELYGVTFARLPWLGLRADAHYSRFKSSFADGSYRSFSLGRNVTDGLRLDVLVGDQTYTSALATSDRTRFVNANFETSFGPRYFMQGGFTVNRGQTQNYDQWLFTLGYRFDSKAKQW